MTTYLQTVIRTQVGVPYYCMLTHTHVAHIQVGVTYLFMHTSMCYIAVVLSTHNTPSLLTYDLLSGVEVHATSTDTGESQIFRGDVALVTVPLGVLKSGKLSFHPPLPEWKKQAVRKLGFGLLNKVCATWLVASTPHALRWQCVWWQCVWW